MLWPPSWRVRAWAGRGRAGVCVRDVYTKDVETRAFSEKSCVYVRRWKRV